MSESHEIASIDVLFEDTPDLAFLIKCTCGVSYRFVREFDPEWNFWNRHYYMRAVEEAYSVLCPMEDPMEKRAVVVTEKEKEAQEAVKKQSKKEEETPNAKKEEAKR